MAEHIYNAEGNSKSRPLLLTILCTITLIGSIIGIFTNVKGYVNAEQEVENISSGQSKTQLRNLFAKDVAIQGEVPRISNLTIENYQKYSIGCVVSYILCLVGTVLMFRLKRTGFYSFTLGTFFNLITHFLLFGDNFGSMGLSILAALSGFLFVILFSLNLKYMDEA
ncbi:MAG TPA: hypothetical protein VE467_08230 [Chryseolinea sp.]|jgi:hypothetical protein|nr:hypothetical protein [Chryseolinea sp.]